MKPRKNISNRENEIKAAKKARNRLFQLVTDQKIELEKAKVA